MSESHDRRQFLKASSLAGIGTVGALSGVSLARGHQPDRQASKLLAAPKHPVSISSGNGIPAVTRALDLAQEAMADDKEDEALKSCFVKLAEIICWFGRGA